MVAARGRAGRARGDLAADLSGADAAAARPRGRDDSRILSVTSPGGRLKVGVIGAGAWGRNHVRTVAGLADAELAAVCDTDAKVRDRLTRQYPGTLITSDVAALLQAVDAVVVASPAATHAKIAQEVIEAGKPVLVEKPFALSARDAEAVARLGTQKGVPVLAGHLLVYHPAVERLRDMVQKGELGKVFYLYGLRVNLGQVRKDENALWSFGPHDVSVALYLLGEQPVRVSASGKSYLQPAIEDVVFLTMEFASGVLAHVQMSWLDPHKERKLTVVGAKKMVVFDDMEPREKLRIYDKGVERPPESGWCGCWTPPRDRWPTAVPRRFHDCDYDRTHCCRYAARESERSDRRLRGRRARLRRAAARDGKRARRLPRYRVRRQSARRRRAERRTLAHPGRGGRDGGRRRAGEEVLGDRRFEPPQRAGRHFDQRADAPGEDERSRRQLRARGDRVDQESPAQRPARRARVHDVPRHDARADAARARVDGAQGGRGFLPRVLAGARRSRQRALQHPQHAEGHRRHHPKLPEGGGGAVPGRDRHAHPGLVARGGGARENSREHLPQREHRARQRNGDKVRQARRRRGGSDAGLGDEARRVHEVRARPRRRRPLHPARPALSRVEDAHAELQDALHRARRRAERRNARVLGRQGRGHAQRAGQGRPR